MTSRGGPLPTKLLQTLRRRNVSLLQGKKNHASLTIVHWSSNSDIEQVDGQKLLGVTIDKHLRFDVHVYVHVHVFSIPENSGS